MTDHGALWMVAVGDSSVGPRTSLLKWLFSAVDYGFAFNVLTYLWKLKNKRKKQLLTWRCGD